MPNIKVYSTVTDWICIVPCMKPQSLV